ncbi:proline-rich transmembrane protein 1-like [Salvelinus namaycush]|uniref:Proline-rich transmembrane protein 1-like n=1 Tax=Salvelinus namaycush TaxID=8040 RepID=A0A8U0QPZ3_SALNM|nr:proline-rich transmembrane protein 1-like [Salvelinus namaycush]
MLLSPGGVTATRGHRHSGGTDERTTTKPHRPHGEDKDTAKPVCCPPPSSPPGRVRPAPACPSADRPQIQPSSPSHHEHLTQERLVKTAHTEGHSDPQRGRRTRGDGSHCTDSDTPTGSPAMGVDTPPVPYPDELSVLLSTQLNNHVREGPGASPSPTQGLAAASRPTPGALSRPEGGQQASPLGPQGPGCPRILQPPRHHKRVSIPALPQGGTNGSLLRSGSSALLANHRTKQLPPPSRGLPCFNSGPQAVSPSLDHGVLAKPRALGVRRELGRTSPPSPSLEMPDLGLLRARVLVPPSLSFIPMPKIH